MKLKPIMFTLWALVVLLAGCDDPFLKSEPEPDLKKEWVSSARDLTRSTVMDIYINERIANFKHEQTLGGAATASGDFYEALLKEAKETFPPGDYMSIAGDNVGMRTCYHDPADFGYVEVWAIAYRYRGDGTVHKRTVFYVRQQVKRER